MTTTEAAASLGLTRAWLWRLVKAGTITATRRGRDWWIEVDEVERYRRERRPAHRPRKDTPMSDEELIDLIDSSLASTADKAAQKRHQNERDEATIAALEAQLVTGNYYLVGHGDQTTRQDVLDAIAGYRNMIERRNA